MRLNATLKTSAAAAVGALVLLAGAPAANAAGAPDDRASCLAKVFQRQAVEAPQTVSNRIKEIREFDLGDTPFGQVLYPLAQVKDCADVGK